MTFRQLIAAYREAAEAERIRNERPERRTVENVLCGVAAVMRTVSGAPKRRGLAEDEPWLDWPIEELTRGRLAQYMVKASASLSPVSIRGYMDALRGITAKWAMDYYRDTGMAVKPFELPAMRRRVQRYGRPGQGTLARVRQWVESLDGAERIVATLMLEFGMRNSDVARLEWGAFSERADGTMVLCYQPHKTRNSSGRTVAWPVHPHVWQRLCEYRTISGGGVRILKNASTIFSRLNKQLRKAGIFTGSKGLYELRKICIDHIYQRFGAEVASSVSGDDIRTVTRFYADPSQVNVGAVSVADMMVGGSAKCA